jgi:GNAT superfamily N-acetyltransferase
MKIRRAGPGDVHVLATLNAYVQDLHVHGNPDVFKPADLRDVARWFSERLAGPDASAWIVDTADGPVAYAIVIRHERAATPFTAVRRFHEIDQIAVRPTARGGGLARALVAHVQEIARQEGASEIILRSWAFNTQAHAAFQRLGFEPQIVTYALPT